jgi:signal transduction histidine kinase
MLHSKVSIPDVGSMNPDPYALRVQETAVVCHELRNSLAVVRGAARLLKSHAESEGIRSIRSLIDRQLDQMSRHIDDLVQPQRRDGQSHELQLSEIDLRLIAADALEAIAPELARRRQLLSVELPAEPIRVRADRARLEQAISNLLINAVKYTPDGGGIGFTMEGVHQQVSMRIRDSGIGIEAAMLPRIFGLFVQVGSAVKSGSGIGLAVVKDVIESHGGTVTASSAGLGLGSEFLVVLPALRT